jgi:hypothetical protein
MGTVLTLRMLIRWRTLLELLYLSSKKNMNITIVISLFKTYVSKNWNEVDRYPIKSLGMLSRGEEKDRRSCSE